MTGPDLHKFTDDLRKKPGNGSDAPPRTLKAKDLDDNFKKVTIIAPQEDPPSYTVEYTREGTRLKIFPSIPSTGTHVLGAVNGSLQWIATEEC